MVFPADSHQEGREISIVDKHVNKACENSNPEINSSSDFIIA